MDALLKSHFENFHFFLSVSSKNILSSEIFVIFAGLPAWMDKRLFDIWHTLGLYLTMNCLTSTFFCILGIWIHQNTVFDLDMELTPHQTTASKHFWMFYLFCLYLHINSPWWNDHEYSIDGKDIPLVDSFSFCSFQDLVWSHSNN